VAEPPSADARAPRPPSLLDALAPVAVLILLIALTIVLFGVDSSGGPLQIALMTSAVFAGLVAFKNGHTVAGVRDAAIGGVTSALGAVFILLAVGALIGAWNLSGTIPTVVSYGLRLLNPAIFYVAVAIICAVVGMVTGSSWTTAGTLGVAFVGIAGVLHLPQPVAAGAVISGAYVGDKMSPLSETTILVPSIVGGVTVQQHIRGMVRTVLPSFVIALAIFLVMGLNSGAGSTADTVAKAQKELAAVFNISPWCLLPLGLLIVLSVLRVPPFIAIFGTAIFSCALAPFTQPQLVSHFVGKPDQNAVLNAIEASYRALGEGFTLTTGHEKIQALFSGGGMVSMLTTVWLIFGALSFAAIMEYAGFLDRLISPLVARARSTGWLIATVVGTCFGLNVVAGDQYVADVMPSRAYREPFARAGLAPRMLSRTVEDSGTVTSPLVPWNSCGAYMTGVLGVPTIEYLPYAFFNIANPLIALLFGFTGVGVEHLPGAGEQLAEAPALKQPAPGRPTVE
jgi:Na+:H+ antiporter, NhaC family